MRVITGKARGTNLQAPVGDEVTRPTSEKVKEAEFSAIQFLISGARVLDLFAGSGQLGIEALSRGASYAVFVDASRDSCNVIKANLAKTGFSDSARVANTDYMRFIASCGDKFDIIFSDPPYRKQLAFRSLEHLAEILAAGGIIMCETEATEQMPEEIGKLRLKKEYKYGKTKIWMYGNLISDGDEQ